MQIQFWNFSSRQLIAWICATVSCQNGVVSTSTTAYPGNVSLVMNGIANYCNSAFADCTNADARILHTAQFSVKSAFSISAFVDIGSFIPGYTWPMNTGSGIGIFDATRGFYVLYCCMISWGGNTYRYVIFLLVIWFLPFTVSSELAVYCVIPSRMICRECKTYNNQSWVGSPSGFTISTLMNGTFVLGLLFYVVCLLLNYITVLSSVTLLFFYQQLVGAVHFALTTTLLLGHLRFFLGIIQVAHGTQQLKQ